MQSCGYLGECSEWEEWEGVEEDVGVRADPVRGGVLPGLEPCSVQQVVQLCGTEGAPRALQRETHASVCAARTGSQ